MKKSTYLSLSLLLLAIGSTAFPSLSVAHDLSRPDAHAPAGVMADHTHNEGEWMMSYSYMTMGMEGNLDGSDDIALADILMPMPGTYMVAPTEMTMGMHMLGAMYAPNDRVTLMLMTNFIDTEMDHVTAMGGAFSTSTSGLGDSSISGLYRLTNLDASNSHLILGLSLPTGSIDETGVTPASAPNETQLPYPMQLGSGSYALEAGYSYNYYFDDWSWGGQVKGKVQLNDNDRDYKLGSRLTASAWAAKPLTPNFSLSARLELQDWADIEGADAALNAALVSNMVPTLDPSLRAGTRVDLGIGINWVTLSSEHSTLRLAAEYLVPVHQDLDGPQLGTDQSLILKTQLSF